MNAFDPKVSTAFSPEIVEAIGRLFLACAAVETALSIQLARLASYPQQIRHHVPFIVSGMDLKVKLANIEICLMIIAPKEIDSARKITRSIRRQFDHRNVIAHNISTQAGDKVKVLMMKMANKGPIYEKSFTAAQIKGFADMAECRARQLDQLIRRIGPPDIVPNALLPPQPDGSQPDPH